jgi:hypothetical protein
LANGLYFKGREGFAGAEIDWDGDDIRAILIDVNDYTVDLASDNNLDDIPIGARIATSTSFVTKSITDGICDAADLSFTAVTGDTITAIVIYKHTGTESTSRLIAYIDSVASGLPLVPNGSDISMIFANTSSKIFKL